LFPRGRCYRIGLRRLFVGSCSLIFKFLALPFSIAMSWLLFPRAYEPELLSTLAGMKQEYCLYPLKFHSFLIGDLRVTAAESVYPGLSTWMQSFTPPINVFTRSPYNTLSRLSNIRHNRGFPHPSTLHTTLASHVNPAIYTNKPHPQRRPRIHLCHATRRLPAVVRPLSKTIPRRPTLDPALRDGSFL